MQSPFWFSAVLDGNAIYTVAGDKLNNLDEFFNDTLGVKPSSESILALDTNKKYCTRVWLSANDSSHPDGGKNLYQTKLKKLGHFRGSILQCGNSRWLVVLDELQKVDT
jgi:hypothetical protein